MKVKVITGEHQISNQDPLVYPNDFDMSIYADSFIADAGKDNYLYPLNYFNIWK